MTDKKADYRQQLKETHTVSNIRDRLRQKQKHSYLRDAIYGAVDGTVTTFAVVSGVAGASLTSEIVIIMGMANLLADGFSMAISNFLGTKAQEQQLIQLRQSELSHISVYPEGEREEIRQIFAKKGFEGEALDSAVEVITSDVEEWVDTMIREEFGLATQTPNAWRAALTTFTAFIIVGLLPVLPFILQAAYPQLTQHPYAWSLWTTALAFFGVGAIKARFVGQSWLKSGITSLLVGGCAAALAYSVGYTLHNWLS